ncbi:MAG: DegT/DnrJ/EryC1/StrS family aminotransferase, partial [Chloroflexota bacterium]
RFYGRPISIEVRDTPVRDVIGFISEQSGANLVVAEEVKGAISLKLKQVPSWVARRRGIAALYHRLLSGMPQLLLPPPPAGEGAYFDVFQNYEIEAEGRDRLKEHLREKGVETFIQWGGRGVHQFKALGLTGFRLPRTERMFERSLLLPMHVELSEEQVRYVCRSIRDFYRL